MSDLKWIKLSIGLYKDRKIRQIRRKKNGDTYALIWIMLLCLAGDVNDRGLIYASEGSPFSPADLADEFGIPEKVAAEALMIFEDLGMIERDGDIIQITNWALHQDCEKQESIKKRNAAERQRRYRERHKSCDDLRYVTRDSNAMSHAESRGVTPAEREIEEEIERELELDDAAVSKNAQNVTRDSLSAYLGSNLLPMSPGNYEALRTIMADGITDDLVRYAVDIATGRGIRTWAYVQGILNDWLIKGIKTVAEAKQEPRPAKTTAKPNPALSYEQRTYTNDDYGDDFFIDLEKEYGDKK